ncbi:hypothetical protein HPB51_010454 [Rhipicephalus microplus]|uniref:Transposable element P transposase-like RNase H domain-containing protein n=1 Tax=Rhipicephalus microplus TaxID=6941 RepID=A0A9J6E1B5_RHIMP|nr:hypothetical protein HPB51_010454 [Rhipicephalus microplus]
MQCFAGLVDLNFWDVTSYDTGSHGSAQSFLAGHVDVTECLPWDCHISPLWNGAIASVFKLSQFNDRGHPLLDQPFIVNCGTMASFTTRSIKPLPEDRLFSGLRYKKDWLYDCLLLKTKSTSVYTYLQENNFLPLPNPRTLYCYMKSLKADFGFDAHVFTVLKEKLLTSPESERRGVLMFDEMSVRKSLHVRESDMKVVGKVDLGEHTRPADREKDADHVLVFLFRPFLGGWSQTADCLAILFDEELLEPGETVEQASLLQHQQSPKEKILDYLDGYVAKKFSSLRCSSCVKSLRSSERPATGLILVKSKGFLLVSSSQLVTLLQIVEDHMEAHTVEKTACYVGPHRSMNTVRGVISDDDLTELSESELLEGWQDQNVVKVQRITIRRNNKLTPTKHVIITFGTSDLPESIETGYYVTRRGAAPHASAPAKVTQCVAAVVPPAPPAGAACTAPPPDK